MEKGNRFYTVISILAIGFFTIAVIPLIGSFAAVGALIVSVLAVIYRVTLTYRYPKSLDLSSYNKAVIYSLVLIGLSVISMFPVVGSITAIAGIVFSILLFLEARKMLPIEELVIDEEKYEAQKGRMMEEHRSSQGVVLSAVLFIVFGLTAGILYNYYKIGTLIFGILWLGALIWFIYSSTRMRIHQVENVGNFAKDYFSGKDDKKKRRKK